MQRERQGAAVLAVVMATALLGIDAARAMAQEPQPVSSRLHRATVLFEQSAIAYSEHRWEAAVALLWEAHSLSHEPVLLYNIGRAYDGAGDRERALYAYRRYLREVPGDANADAARARVLELEVGVDEERVREVERSLAEEARSAEEARRLEEARRIEGTLAVEEATRAERARHGGDDAARAAPWIVAAGGGLVIVGGAVLAGLAVERRDAAARAETLADAVGTFHDAEALSATANVLFAAGGLLAAIGLGWGIGEVVSGSGERASGRVDVALGPGGISVCGSFE